MRFGGSRRRRVWRRTWPLPRDAAADTSATHQGAPTGCAAIEESTELAGPMSSASATGLASRWGIEVRSRVMGSPGILRPGERRYDEARRVWNAMVDRRPALIAGCSHTADVVAAVARGRRADLEIRVHRGSARRGCRAPGQGGELTAGGASVRTLAIRQRHARGRAGAPDRSGRWRRGGHRAVRGWGLGSAPFGGLGEGRTDLGTRAE